MAEANERIMTDYTCKEIIEALRNIPGVVGATPIDRGGTGATTKEDALRNLGAQPVIGVDVEEELGKMVKSVNSITPDPSGNIQLTHVRIAENLASDDAQDIYGEFIERTTGGSASLTDGKSWIGIMEGNSIRTGYSPEQKSVQVMNMPRTPITASIVWNDFRVAVNFLTTNKIFSYDGTDWSDDPEDYGITVTGYPISGDTISVSLTAKSESYNVVSDAGITVSIDWSTYESAYEISPVGFFSYASGEWSQSLNTYGITVTGNPMDGDVINVSYTPEVHAMYVNPATRGAEVVAYVNWDTFKETVSGEDSTITITYGTDWSASLNDYGVSISGGPIKGDQIILYFTNEVRGSIVNATPTRFVSTGWNLYDNNAGYARVLKYSDTHGFKIEGTYTGITFATTPVGETSSIAVDSDGNFNIPSDGYVIVSGGNAYNTCIYMTWSDWTEGTPLEFADYYESALDLTSLMQATFPYGLCAVGSTCDDIDFANKIANSRIERMAYSAANLAIAKSSGREYAYDDNYIYIVKVTPTSVGFSLNYELDAFDHGLERVEGTTVPVFIHMLYGQNLRDKLRTDVVTISQQVLTSAQKQQIRENLGLGGSAELPIQNGGTGATDASGARSNLGLGAAALKGIAASIASTDTGIPTAALVSQAVGAVSEQITNIKAYSFSKEDISITANSYADISFDVTKSGCTALGVVGWQLSGSSAVATIYARLSTSTTGVIRAKNLSSSDITLSSAILLVLYK